ncbi:hypothetical protein [Clostridium amazonitimonense]|uniref:hypothetical protein n=1 Tax=Clostridium amazonitimonense TaxID=1499689 RepID=UPI000509FCD5|nr:hypothetical protein [Clostridium amazonitimonense]
MLKSRKRNLIAGITALCLTVGIGISAAAASYSESFTLNGVNTFKSTKTSSLWYFNTGKANFGVNVSGGNVNVKFKKVIEWWPDSTVASGSNISSSTTYSNVNVVDSAGYYAEITRASNSPYGSVTGQQ